MNLSPIATYLETRFEGKRTFVLWPDEIRVTGTQFLSSDFALSIPLKSLSCSTDQLWLRSPAFNVGVLFIISSVIVLSVLIGGLGMAYDSLAPLLFGVFGIAGCLLALVTFRKVEFVRFKNDQGIVLLDVGRAGKLSSHFDTFVGQVTQQIREVHEPVA